jgi:hypothetical protein
MEGPQTASEASSATQVAGAAEGAPAANVGDPGPADLDARVIAAFGGDVRSGDVAKLLVDVEAAATSADIVAKAARDAAMDPLLSKTAVNRARRESDDARFQSDRLGVAAKRLGERLKELRAIEIARAQRAEHEGVVAARDKLAAEMERMAEPLAQVAVLVAQIDEVERLIRRINPMTGQVLGYIRPTLSGAGPVIASLFGGDVTVWDGFLATAQRLSSLPLSPSPKLRAV